MDSVKQKTNNKIVLILLIVSIFLIGIGLKLSNMQDKEDPTKKNLEKTITNTEYNDPGLRYTTIVNDTNGIPKFIYGTFDHIKIEKTDDIYNFIGTFKKEMHFEDSRKEFSFADGYVPKDNGIGYYKYNQVYNRVPVYNSNIVVWVYNDNIMGMSIHYIPNIKVDTNPKVTRADIEKLIKEQLGENATLESNKLYIYPDNKNTKLVYVATGYSNNEHKEFIIDANDKSIIQSSNLIDELEVTGIGIDNNNYQINIEKDANSDSYKFIDRDRNIYVYDMSKYGDISAHFRSTSNKYESDANTYTCSVVDGKILLENDMESTKTAITTMKNFEEIYDYYNNVLGRKSYDNNGTKIEINIGVKENMLGNAELNNAFWDRITREIYIGNKNGKSYAASKDVLAHEFTHAVIQDIVSLTSIPNEEDKNQAFETGALSEGFADVFACLIEGNNWTIAEDNEILRNLANPSVTGHPSEVGGENYFPDSYLKGRSIEQLISDNNWDSLYSWDKGGSHKNSTIVGHTAYLMYKNGAFSSKEEMAQVWYNALYFLPANANFEDCALAVLKSAELFGISIDKIEIIRNAFIKTKMLKVSTATLFGTVSSGNKKLENVSVEIINKNTKQKITTKTNKDGNFKKKLETGVYEIKFSKLGYAPYEQQLLILGDTILELNMTKKQETKACSGSNCHKVTLYTIDSIENGKISKSEKIYYVKDGYTIQDGLSEYGVNGTNEIGAWYYKGTNKKFDLSTPIHEDIELEIKIGIEGDYQYDIDDMEDLYNMFTNPETQSILDMLPD